MAVKTFVLLMILGTVLSTAGVRAQQANVTGFFSDMHVGSTTGDVGGATIFISYGAGQYYAFVQTAEGVPSEPALAPVIVDGDSITIKFTVGKYKDISPFTGRVSGDALIGRFSNGWGFRLPRMAFPKQADDAVRAPVADSVVWKVGLRSVGPLRYGMKVSDASGVLGETLRVEPSEPGGRCAYTRASAAPWGVSFMVVDSVLERVDVDEGKVATLSGAHVGSTEDEVKALYPGRIEVQPHPYSDGHYLIYVPQDSSNSSFRIIFETNGGKVDRYRAGRRPAVEYIEGCS